VNCLRDNPMTQFSVQWILSLNRLSQNWGQVQFISGYLSATDYIVLTVSGELGGDFDSYKFMFRQFWPLSLNVVEVHAALDRFYETSENALITIPKALFFIICEREVATEQRAETGVTKTHGQSNGGFWKSLDAQGKKLFISGYLSATDYIMLTVSGDFDTYKTMSRLFWPPALKVDEVHAALDRFYETSENGLIAISGALSVISERAAGTDEATVQKKIADLRAKSQ